MRKTASGYRLIFGYLGIFLIVIGAICLLPLIMLIPFSAEVQYAKNFYIPGIASIVIGVALSFLICKRDKAKLGRHQDSVLLVLLWILAILICAVPFVMSGNMSFTESVFESTSGFATVGLTRFNMFDSHIYIFYRSLILFFGGIGLVLVVTSAISDRYGLKLYIAEGHNDKLMPNLAKSARIILGIYVAYIAVGTVAYILSGMDWFDAINHSISALATGGFSSRKGGILECAGNQTAIQIISVVLMLLGGTNFLIHFFLITGKFKRVRRDLEIRFFVILVLVFIPLFFVACLLGGNNLTAWEAFKYGSFTFVSSITTTGFSNVASIPSLGNAAMFLIIIMCVIGGGMGSTAGGCKQYRVALALKSFYWNIAGRSKSKRIIHPHLIYRCGEQKQPEMYEILEAFGYIVLYLLVLAVGSFLTLMFAANAGFRFGDCLFEFANALSSTGLSCGLTAKANNGMLWTMTAGMFAGRLEILAIYFAAFRIVRDICRKETI